MSHNRVAVKIVILQMTNDLELREEILPSGSKEKNSVVIS